MFNRNQPSTGRSSAAFQELCFLPSLTLIVFLRRRIGIRLLNPMLIVRTVVLLYLYSICGTALMGGSASDIQAVQIFDLCFAILAGLHYWRAWREFNRGVRSHSYSSGISYAEHHGRYPAFFRAHRRVVRFLEPFCCLVIGLYIAVVSLPLGVWIVLSSISLSCFEQARYELALLREFETVDALVEGEIQVATVQFFSGNQTESRDSKRTQVPTIQAGLAPDIEPQIARLRARRNNKP